jgi:hypothetical protein
MPRTCVEDVHSLCTLGLVGVGGRAVAALSSELELGDGDEEEEEVVEEVVSSPVSTLEIRFAIRTLSICAMEMMFPWPRICVAAFMVISGVSSSSSHVS